MENKSVKGLLEYIQKQIDLPAITLISLCIVWTSTAVYLNDDTLIYPLMTLVVVVISCIFWGVDERRVDNFFIDRKIEKFELLSHRKVSYMGKFVYIAIVGIVVMLFLLSIINGQTKGNAMLLGLSIMVTAYPKNIDTMLYGNIVYNIKKLERKNICMNSPISIMDKVKNINTLILSKDNVLVQGKMRVMQVYDYKEDIMDKNKEKMRLINTLAVMCNNCHYINDKWVGSDIDMGLIVNSIENGIDVEETLRDIELLWSIDFTDKRRIMTTIHKIDDTHFMTVTKGAVENILERSKYVLDGTNGIEITKNIKTGATILNGKISSKGLTTIGIAYRYWDKLPDLDSDDLYEYIEKDLTFVGMIGLMNLKHDMAKKWVDMCYKSDINPVLVTGGHELAIKNLAERLGIKNGAESVQVIDGKELLGLTKDGLREVVNKNHIFTRVNKTDRGLIEQGYVSNGRCVGVVGEYENIEWSKRGIKFCVGDSNICEEYDFCVDNLGDVVEIIERGKGIDKWGKWFGDIWRLSVLCEIVLWICILIFGEISGIMGVYMMCISFAVNCLCRLIR